jgi:two-component system torCAD operon response regulator TorR
VAGAGTAHLLIVEDEEFVRQLVAAYLEKDGYRLSVAGSAKAMHDVLDREKIDLIILDLGLPDEDGLTLIRQLRTRSAVPIVVLTARQTRADRLTALEIGADDYVTKPVDPQELALRIANLLRRSGGGGTQDAKARDVLSFGGWRLDISANALHAPDGLEVGLTRAEFDILTALARAPNRVLSRDFLLDAISRDGDAPSDRVIDVMISRLRKKLGDDPRRPMLIQTVTGRGYRLSVS